MKKTVWNTILKVIIAVASAIAGVIGGQAMSGESSRRFCERELARSFFICVCSVLEFLSVSLHAQNDKNSEFNYRYRKYGS